MQKHKPISKMPRRIEKISRAHQKVQHEISKALRDVTSRKLLVTKLDAIINRELAKAKTDGQRVAMLTERINWLSMMDNLRPLSRRALREIAENELLLAQSISIIGSHLRVQHAMGLYRRLGDEEMVAYCKEWLRAMPGQHASMLGTVKKWTKELEKKKFRTWMDDVG